jgi:hypothetical protein
VTLSYISDPLAAVNAATSLVEALRGYGYSIATSSDLNDLQALKKLARDKDLTPLFDPTVSGLSAERVFWMQLISKDGQVFGMQAFRYDYVDTSLSDWGPTYIMGLYMRLKELLVPTLSPSPPNSIADRIRGRLIYHGELWIDPHARNRKLLDAFSRLGIILSVLKWNPDAVWALTSEKMAMHGNPIRMGYGFVEGGFLRWEWAPNDNPRKEWLLVADKKALTQLVTEVTLDRDTATLPDAVSAHRQHARSQLEELFSIR